MGRCVLEVCESSEVAVRGDEGRKERRTGSFYGLSVETKVRDLDPGIWMLGSKQISHDNRIDVITLVEWVW
jgi:hypothetical protein